MTLFCYSMIPFLAEMIVFSANLHVGFNAGCLHWGTVIFSIASHKCTLKCIVKAIADTKHKLLFFCFISFYGEVFRYDDCICNKYAN